MNVSNWIQYLFFFLIVAAAVKPLGSYLARVYEGGNTWLDPALKPLERAIYRLLSVDPQQEMRWNQYAFAFLAFSLLGTLLLYLLLRLQSFLPWFYPKYHTTPLSPDLAMNASISFSTTTTWQAYAGESTMSYLSQTLGLGVQNFLAGAAGLAVGIAFIRGFARQQANTLGNFWFDLIRSVLWVLLPFSLIGSLLLVWQGVPMNFNSYQIAQTLSGQPQIIPQGPIASFEIIKNLGTNGGGFFNANGAHPYENPTPLTGLIEMLAIVLLPAALTCTYGRMSKRPRQGWMLFGVMSVLFFGGLFLCDRIEQKGNVLMAQATPLTLSASDSQPGGNLEGKEMRFGIAGSVLTAITVSNGATGSYNSMHDSFLPLSGGVLLFNMLLGEIAFGGLGSGLYSLIMIALLGLFIAGLMVGRTPEFAGKRLEALEIKLIMIYTLVSPAAILLLSGIPAVSSGGLAALTTNQGTHGLSAILFNYATCAANNGQNFAGFNGNSLFWNFTTSIAMIIGRFGLAIPALALAGSFARQKNRPETVGSVPTDNFTFALLVIGAAIIVGGLTYLPALALGPFLEHFQLYGAH